MTYVVARPRRGFEIRESVSTPSGPRARTLATFRVLSERVLEHAASRAERPFDREQVMARAAALGASHREDDASHLAARQLLAALRGGAAPPPALVGPLRTALAGARAEVPDSIEPVLDWIGVSESRRGDALRDLLRLTDRIPRRRRPATPSFPGIHPASDS
jgi:hypothetical protein